MFIGHQGESRKIYYKCIIKMALNNYFSQFGSTMRFLHLFWYCVSIKTSSREHRLNETMRQGVTDHLRIPLARNTKTIKIQKRRRTVMFRLPKGEVTMTNVVENPMNNATVIVEEAEKNVVATEIEVAFDSEIVEENIESTTPIVTTVISSEEKVIPPPPSIDYEQYRFRPTDYMKKLSFEERAEKMIAENPDQEEAITASLLQKKKDHFGVEIERGREVLNPNLFAHSLDSVLDPRMYSERLYLYNYYRGVYQNISDNELKAITSTIVNSLSLSLWKRSKESEYIASFRNYAMSKHSYTQYFHGLKYIAFTNGTLDILSGELLPHSPSFNCSNSFNYAFDETAQCPLFEQTLNIIFQGDQSLVESFRDMFGAFLLHGEGDSIDRFFIFLGAGGNGKSVIADVIAHVMSEENCSAKPLADLSKEFAMASIYDKMLNISSEEKRTVIDTELLKLITSSDRVSINQKYQVEFKAKPHVKLLSCANHLPDFRDDSDGLLRRIQVFPFNVRFVNNPNKNNPLEYPKDPHLKAKLFAEREGILNWALVGSRRVYTNGMQVSMAPASKKFVEKIKTEANPVRVFVESCIFHANGAKIASPNVFNQYQTWLNTHQIMNKRYNNQTFHKEFQAQLEANGFPCVRKMINGDHFYYDFEIDWTYPCTPDINF